MAKRLTKFNPAREKSRKAIVSRQVSGARATSMAGPADNESGRNLAAMQDVADEIHKLTRFYTFETPDDTA